MLTPQTAGGTAAARIACLSIVVGFLLFLHSAAPTVRASGSTFVVDRTDDGVSSGCSDPSKHDCTLRGAIENANASGTFNNIRFSKKINWALNPIVLSASLPAITSQGTWIDGRNEDGPLVYPVIDANGVGDAIVIAASDVTISNLSVYGAPASAADIHILQRATLGLSTIDTIQIAYNWIGAPRNGTSCASLTSANNTGVRVDADTSSGVAAYIYGNVVVCHGGPGIYLARDFGNLVVNVPSGPVRVGQRPDNTPDGNWIGVNPLGNPMPNDVGISVCQSVNDQLIANILAYNAHDGVVLSCAAGSGVLDAQHILVGGSASERNYIYGNGGNGIHLNGAATTAITVSMNLIGTDGTVAVPNQAAGILIEDAPAAQTALVGNFISGNAGAGVWIKNSAHVALRSNTIGLNSTGSSAIPNGTDGVAITAGSNHIMVGGPTSAERNFIAGNTFSGVYLGDAGTVSNTVASNFIGLNGTGDAAVPNGYAGIAIIAADNNTIGGGGSGLQFITGNTREGVYMANASNIFVDQSNFIGVGSNQTSALGNGLEGVKLDSGAHGAHIAPALVADNGGSGIAVIGTATANQIVPLAVRANGGLPIDLAEDGATPNDPGDGDTGPNTLLNYPVITTGAGSSVSGSACANCMVHIYQATGNPAAAGGGGTHVAATPANGTGNWSITLPNSLTRADVSLVAVDQTGDSSEMSPRPTATITIFLPLIRR